MKKKSFIILLSLFILGCSEDSFEELEESIEKQISNPQEKDQLKGEGIRVATYNVGHFNNGNLGGYQGNNVHHHLNLWRDWFNHQELDILVLNEWNLYFDNANQVHASDYLLKPIFKNIFWGPRGAWVYNGICTNFEVNQDSFNKIIWDKSTYNAISLDIIIDSTIIHIISTHIPWQAANHKNALNELIEELKKHDFFICMGDLNATDTEQLRFKDLGFNIANGGEKGFFKTYEGSNNVHLDNIITSSNIEIIDVVSPKLLLNQNDHYPLEAVVRIH